MPNPDAHWSAELRQATKAAIEEWASLPVENNICFKHISSSFGLMDFADLMQGNLQMIVRGTGEAIDFTNADELISAGWAID